MCFLVFESADGTEVGRLPFTDPALSRYADSWAYSFVETWLDDGSGVVLNGNCQCDSPAAGPIVIVTLDGDVIDSGVSIGGGSIAPSGRYAVAFALVETWEIDELGCWIFGLGEVVDLLNGNTVGAVGGPGEGVIAWSWIDGQTLEYTTRPLPDPDAGSCTEQTEAWQEIPATPQRLTLA